MYLHYVSESCMYVSMYGAMFACVLIMHVFSTRSCRLEDLDINFAPLNL